MSMMNQGAAGLAAALLCLAAWTAQADHEVPLRLARVVQVTPLYDNVERTERTACGGVREGRSVTPVIIGAIVGAVVGNEIHKDGAVGEIAGGALGASVARDMQNGGRRDCTRRRVERVSAGYDVRYQYDGALYVAHMWDPPREGERIEVEVRAVPVSTRRH